MFLLIIISSWASTASGQFSTTMTVETSNFTGDSYEIYVSLPGNFDSSHFYNVLYYCDANLKSGKLIRKMLSTADENFRLTNSIFIGIGHIGNYHVLRRRDFIQPSIKNNDTAAKDKNYGQAENFYRFLSEELIASINSKFKTNQEHNSILGHSLGGLFVFYCLFKNDHLFEKYFALSPALWIDKYSIYRFYKKPAEKGSIRYLYFASGSKETANHILKGTNEMKTFLDNGKFTDLQYDYKIIASQTHNSEVPFSLEEIFASKL